MRKDINLKFNVAHIKAANIKPKSHIFLNATSKFTLILYLTFTQSLKVVKPTVTNAIKP